MKKFFFSAMVLACFAIGFTASDEEDLGTPGQAPVDTTGIPQDSEAEPNPVVTNPTTTIPNIQSTVVDENGTLVFRFDMTGVKNQGDYYWMRLYGTSLENQNIWVQVDGQPKAIDVYNTADQDEEKTVDADIVFTIDNSGSMGQEADAIARDIIAWAQLLANSQLNARFAVVGYGGNVSGAIDLTDVESLKNYLNYASGTSRTKHFGGENANDLRQKANNWQHPGSGDSNECGAMAIEFANEYFSFRNTANRIYVNFTDEPNQPRYIERYSVKYFENQQNWPAAYGTVHTVYSDSHNYSNSWNYSEWPWLISEYTGGTVQYIKSNASDLDLTKLTVTEAMQNSYIIRMHGIGEYINDGQAHDVHITIVSNDGTVQADNHFQVEFVM